MENNLIRKEQIFKYSYYDDSNKLIVVLDEQGIKDIFGADELVWDEPEHK